MKLTELCICGHSRGWHKRGWGPCTHTCRTTVLDTDGATVSDTINPCTCRQMETRPPK